MTLIEDTRRFTLVTGATGFVGSHVARLLAGRGDRVRVLVRPSSDLRALEGLAVERAPGDLRDPGSLDRALSCVRTVFHVAADYRLWARNPQEIYESNVTGTRNLLDAARRAGVERVVYTSTVATVAVPRPTLPNEATASTIDEMIGHYKRSKWLAEQEAFRAAQQGLPVVIVNPSTPVGEMDIKPTPTGRMIVVFLREKMFGYVDTGMNLIDVRDVAEGHWLASQKGRLGEKYILGHVNLTLKEIFDRLAKISGLPSPRVSIPYWVAAGYAHAENLWTGTLLHQEPTAPLEGVRMSRWKMWFDSSKAVSELGLPQNPIENALERAVRWFYEKGYTSPH